MNHDIVLQSDISDMYTYIMCPKLWNSLPINIHEATSLEQFKKLLKTYLFNCAYDSLFYNDSILFTYIIIFPHVYECLMLLFMYLCVTAPWNMFFIDKWRLTNLYYYYYYYH